MRNAFKQLFVGAFHRLPSGLPATAGSACLLLLLCATSTFAAVRVALITAGAAESTNPAIALASAELSPTNEVQLVDRESIDAILHEQKLSRSGLVEGEQMIRVGRLMKADLFAIADTDSEGRILGLVIFDTATGLCLSNAATAGDPEQIGKSIAAAIRAAAVKDRTLPTRASRPRSQTMPLHAIT